MVEFDKILESMGGLSRRQWIQLSLMMVPCVLVGSQMGAMVYLGADVGARCPHPMEEQLVEKCNKTWTEDQTMKLVPWDDKKDGPSTCSRYNLTTMDGVGDCSYWWNDEAPPTNATTRAIFNETKAETVACSSWKYNESLVFTSTVVNEFNLVCSDAYKRHLSQAIFMFGVTVGCVFWGQVSDSYGRKRGIEVSAILGTGFAIAVAFSNSYAVFVLLRSLSGSCLFPSFTTAFVLATEIVAPKYRVRVGQTCQAFFALGFCVLAMYGYFVREWRKLQLLLSVPILSMVSYYWIVFESPRWLIASKRYVEANSIVQMLIRSSGGNVRIDEATYLQQVADGKTTKRSEEEEDGETEEEKRSYGPMDLVRTPNMRSKSLKLCYCWLVCSCVYYGLTLNSADLGGDPFINLFLSGFVEIPAVFLCIPMLEKWGRRLSLSFTLILSGVACVAMLSVPKELLWLNITLSMIGKFAIAAAFGTVYIYAAELYPTPIRNVGIGVCSSSARVGGIISPFVAMLSSVARPLPYVVFGVMSIVGGLLALLLPEVLGIPLPETLKEGEEFGLDQPGLVALIGKRLARCKEGNGSGNEQLANLQYVAVSDNGNGAHVQKI